MGYRSVKSLFLSPRSVVFIGIPRKSGPGSLNPIDNLRNWGYPGRVEVVHPHVREVAGLPVTQSVSDLNSPVDLAVISTPRETVPGIIKECAEVGIGAAVVVVQGFSEADSRGKELQEQMLAEAIPAGVRILGPNTLGVSNAFSRFNSSFMPLDRHEVPVGVVCQSGVFFVGADQLIGGMGIGVDVGNGCDVDTIHALEWLGEDERLRVIALHAEEIRRGCDFLEVAEKVSRRIPVIALKTGRSHEGARAAASHSGSMAGEDRIVGAALRKAGVIRVDETQDQMDLVRGFVRLPAMKGRRVAVVTLTGAGGIILLDAMERHGLKTAALSEHSLSHIQSLSPDWMPLVNPVDIWPAVMKNGMHKAYAAALKGALADRHVDAVLCVTLGLKEAEQRHLGAEAVIQDLSEKFEKPIVVWCYGAQAHEASTRLEEHGRALAVPSLERGIRVLAAMARYQAWKDLQDPLRHVDEEYAAS
ncbi:MAG: CoA-binding protein [Desulfomonile tiedjei]|nr:CoA-binding protein [Desulfomonile tiedjei]